MTKQQNRGFTLIELLVVISIIGLLSSVVLSSVNTARKKADNTQRNQVVDEYRKALMLSYDANGGVYPGPGNTNTYCLGDYPVLGAYNDVNVCGYSYSPSNENAIINNALTTYIKGLPVTKTAAYDSFLSGQTYNGPTYACTTTQCKSVTITWALQGNNQKCIRGASSYNWFGTTACSIILN